MQAIRDFFAMGGYAAFVWPSFVACAALMGGLAIISRRRQRRIARRLDELERLVQETEKDQDE